MAKVTRLSPKRARRLGETVFTDDGLRLPPARKTAVARWLWPAMIGLPLCAGLLAFLVPANLSLSQLLPSGGAGKRYMSASDPWSKDYDTQAATSYAAYPNCAAARAAGAAPVHYGEPGYGPHLDRDGDGVGCEPYYGR